MKYVCSLIAVKNINKSKQFYENILYQKIKYDFGENVTFEGDFAIHQQKHFSQLIDNKPIHKESNSFELYFECDNIEDAEQRLIDYKVDFIHKIKEQPWRQRVIRFYDPDRHIIEVGESLEFLAFRLFKESKSYKEIEAIISMPEEFIKSSIIKFRN
jgi:catechol 2,3-dioxygenase-like lactoylglutathione lyase family enzyme